MAKLFIRHKVADYAAWRVVFDQVDSMRRALGSTGAEVLVNAADPSEVIVIETYPSLDKARQWSQSPDLHKAMQNAGVISEPELLFLEEA